MLRKAQLLALAAIVCPGNLRMGESMLRIVSVVAALQLLAWTPALAQQVCSGQAGGQVGSSVFKDTFADDTYGWDEHAPESTAKPPNFVFAMDANTVGDNVIDLTFNASDGDYCADFILPPAIAANNQMYAGIVFWATADYNNMMQLQLGSNASVYLSKLTSGTWSTLYSVQNAPGFKSAANSVNTLRVTAVSGLITVYVNGSMVRALRTQASPAANNYFGMNAFSDTAAPNWPQVLFKNYSVTSGVAGK
jgi:hypothetical protein